jgi:hypothetical protein
LLKLRLKVTAYGGDAPSSTTALAVAVVAVSEVTARSRTTSVRVNSAGVAVDRAWNSWR